MENREFVSKMIQLKVSELKKKEDIQRIYIGLRGNQTPSNPRLCKEGDVTCFFWCLTCVSYLV